MKKWELSKSKTIKPKITATIKDSTSKIACDLIDNILKPKHINPERHDVNLNQLVDIFIKWRGSSLFFYGKYNCYGENAISPSFESKFARLYTLAKINLIYLLCVIMINGLSYTPVLLDKSVVMLLITSHIL